MLSLALRRPRFCVRPSAKQQGSKTPWPNEGTHSFRHRNRGSGESSARPGPNPDGAEPGTITGSERGNVPGCPRRGRRQPTKCGNRGVPGQRGEKAGTPDQPATPPRSGFAGARNRDELSVRGPIPLGGEHRGDRVAPTDLGFGTRLLDGDHEQNSA